MVAELQCTVTYAKLLLSHQPDCICYFSWFLPVFLLYFCTTLVFWDVIHNELLPFDFCWIHWSSSLIINTIHWRCMFTNHIKTAVKIHLKTDQTIDFWIFTDDRFAIMQLLLVLNKQLYVCLQTSNWYTVWWTCSLLTSFEEQSQQWKQSMSKENNNILYIWIWYSQTLPQKFLLLN